MTENQNFDEQIITREQAKKYAGILDTEKAYLRANHEQLAKQYPAQYVVIKGEAVRGVASTYEEAVKLASRMFRGGHCLVRSVHQPEDGPPLWIPTLSLGLPLLGRGGYAGF